MYCFFYKNGKEFFYIFLEIYFFNRQMYIYMDSSSNFSQWRQFLNNRTFNKYGVFLYNNFVLMETLYNDSVSFWAVYDIKVL